MFLGDPKAEGHGWRESGSAGQLGASALGARSLPVRVQMPPHCNRPAVSGNLQQPQRRLQGRLEGLRERLAEEVRGRTELEAAHQERVRDLCKRLQAEHLLRWGRHPWSWREVQSRGWESAEGDGVWRR